MAAEMAAPMAAEMATPEWPPRWLPLSGLRDGCAYGRRDGSRGEPAPEETLYRQLSPHLAHLLHLLYLLNLIHLLCYLRRYLLYSNLSLNSGAGGRAGG
ncbi:hypothetical protein BDV95DRAFT_609752 [Massariosphaeria phaeospora]|uniref:Uncharacterized protein n=1 Tax=Massariosphaeria phaeospora TaxID=100035 RepID=A0A7C8I429_9PLEO|nr:hypothetical protein BDV95DRAFT_609752 [Massariosphaeria phaeospora]